MSADPEEPERPPGPPEPGRLRPMSPAGLCIVAAVGLRRRLGLPPGRRHRHRSPAPGPWAQPLALFLVAAILFGTAWATRRSITQHPGRLSPHQAVNRLVLARACAYVGALAAGVYIGYAVSWLGVSSTDLAGQRAFRAACAGVSGVLIVAGGLLLERACRVPPEDDEP